ncbi:MAG TPA: Trm112 family protein [Flavobacteriaceae bacterium]|nr:Trm112 family protein [Flavobacteriaceae bacterium]
MKLETILNKLCCPFDKADLTLDIVTQDIDKNILEGILSCIECKRIYPIVKGIPIMNPDEYREFDMEKPMLEKWEKMKSKTIQASETKTIEK